jgi:alkylation response protein AidB-like acyl-CoA dehydrogenase
MDLSLSDDQQSIVDLFDRFLDRECPPERVREAERSGFDADLWKQVSDMGLVSMGLPESHGGGGLGLLDLALVAETFGAHLAPVPFVEAVVAARLLAGAGGDVPDGLTTLALHPAVDGVARLVPGGAAADAVVALDGDDLVVAGLGPEPRPAPPNLASAPVADCALDGAARLDSGPGAHRRHAAALDEWRVLTAAALTGLAAEALRLGVGYVQGRRQFGVPIGSFQAVQHALADVATAVDGSRLAAREAAWAADTGAADATTLACIAFLHAARTADRAAGASLHFHGGYGFMLEYDVQLHLRRARAWHLALGDPAAEEQVLADRLWRPVTSGAA